MSADSNTGFQPSSDNRPVCQYFARRQCKKGRFCNFLHVITIDRDNQPGNELPLSDQNSAEHSQGNSVEKNPKKISNKNVPHHKKSGTVCKHWAQKGWCRFGNGCRYSHVNHKEDEEVHLSDKAVEDSQIAASEAQQPAVSEAALPDTEELPYVAASNTEAESQTELKCQSNNENTGMKSSDKSPRKSKPVCRYFNYGYCANGRRCRFLHQRDQLNSVSKRKGEAVHVDAKTETKRSTLEQKVGETCSIKKTDCEKTFEDMRKTEITQFCKRFPDAKEVVENSTFRFVFTPTDPDWPYDVKEMNIEVTFPENYPQEMLVITLVERPDMPKTVERMLTESIQEWITNQFESMKSSGVYQCCFRSLLHWLDKNAEELFTEALKQLRRERIAEAAGIQFIPAQQLQRIYTGSTSESSDNKTSNPNEIVENSASSKEANIVEEKEIDEESKENVDHQSLGRCNLNPAKRGTELTLQNLQLLSGVASLSCTQIKLIIACSRCTNTSEIKTAPSQSNSMRCPFCQNAQSLRFSSALAHQFSSVIGYVDLDGCHVVDVVLADCRFSVGCLGCSKDNVIEALSPGQLNDTWCRSCHQKLTVSANNVRFVKLISVKLDASNEADSKKRIKSVKDPSIQEGKPLPDFGTCHHFKKSFRWLRFPCCGKAYPCDYCHDEKESDHEMKRATRMICGYCGKEQPYTVDKPCVSCNAMVTNKSTSHWEGGKGCRDKIKMSRGDSKKYVNTVRTISKSSQEKLQDSNTKITKLRHI